MKLLLLALLGLIAIASAKHIQKRSMREKSKVVGIANPLLDNPKKEAVEEFYESKPDHELPDDIRKMLDEDPVDSKKVWNAILQDLEKGAITITQKGLDADDEMDALMALYMHTDKLAETLEVTVEDD